MLLYDPRRHAALVLHVRRLDGIEQIASKVVRRVEQQLFVDDETVRAVGEADAADGVADARLEADARRQAREEQPPGRQHPPHLRDHTVEMDAIPREAAHGPGYKGVPPAARQV